MFSANCDHCGASNEFPASAQKDGIEAGSLIHCPQCGKELRVRLAADDAGDAPQRAVAGESVGEPVGEAIAPNDELGDDEATQVLEWGSLPDSAKRRLDASPADDAEPMTLRRKSDSADATEAGHTPTGEAEAVALAEGPLAASPNAEPAPESLVPLSERDFIDSQKPGRHLPSPPTRGRRAALRRVTEEAPVSAGSPPLAALVRKATPHPPRREHHEAAAEQGAEARGDAKPGARDAMMPPATPADEQWDAPLAGLRPPTATEAPVASLSRPPDAPKPATRSGGTLGFLLLVAGVAFVAGMAVKNAQEGASNAPAIPAATPISEAKPVDPIPQPLVQGPAPAAPPAELPSETPAVASPPPALAAPESEQRRPQLTPTVHAAKVSSAEQSQKQPSANEAGSSEAPSSTVLPVRSANVATDAPPVEVAFDSEATAGALDAAAQRASSCRKQSDPSGVAVVTITFAPSGRVTSANISGPPFAGTETGSCIASVLRSVKVPAYSGDFMTVRKTINVQ